MTIPERTGPKPYHWSHWVSPEPNSGCWLWTGDVDHQSGRAALTRHINGRRTRLNVPRLVWEEAHGAIPNGLMILHKCNVSGCVNPDHLYAGTHIENMRDMTNSGVQRKVRRTHCPRGHRYDLRYSYDYQNTHQLCSTCNRERCLAYYGKRKARLNAERVK